MKQFILKNKLKLAGILLGAAGGYAYYHFVGCTSGSCAISSNPWRMTLYGALMGFLLFSLFATQPASSFDKNNTNQKQ